MSDRPIEHPVQSENGEPPSPVDNSVPTEGVRLKSVLQTWADDAISKIRSSPASFVQTYTAEQWQLGSDGHYRRGAVSRVALSHDAVDELKRLPNYAALEKAA